MEPILGMHCEFKSDSREKLVAVRVDSIVQASRIDPRNIKDESVKNLSNNDQSPRNQGSIPKLP